jgi:RimJ/RimL family protein N-acetyltransferase
MPELTFHPLDTAGYHFYSTWFRDPELARRIEPPTQEWLHYVTTMPGVYAWLIYHAMTPVGQVQLDTTPEHRGTIAFAVNPALRQRGYGTAILRALLTRPEAARLHQIDAAVEPDNTASRRCLVMAGFVLLSDCPDDDGFLHYIYAR